MHPFIFGRVIGKSMNFYLQFLPQLLKNTKKSTFYVSSLYPSILEMNKNILSYLALVCIRTADSRKIAVRQLPIVNIPPPPNISGWFFCLSTS